MSETSISRRDLFTRSRDIGGLATLAALLTRRAEGAGDGGARDVYTSIGVRPFINARGTYTILSGSTMLPEVRAAMDQAARQYVHLDELTDAIGARLAALTSAEWGLVTSGCAAALTHATAACVAGGNPDLHVRMPDLRGFAKDEVIIPRHSRNVYDAAIRSVGVRVIEASTLAELEAALGPRTAMVYVLAGPEADKSQLTVAAMAPLTRPRGVPILVDAAAEILTIPNIHLQNGATLVGYSGGKCLRGPQTAGLLLGRKDLVKAAWVHSAPHHGFARAMKVGKEEAIGMLAAVEQWVRRDHDAEWRQWTAWLDEIAQRVKTVEGIGLSTEVTQPAGLSNRTPSLRITWDREAVGTTGDLVAQTLFQTEPRISLFPARSSDEGRTGVSITPYMMAPGDAAVVAGRLHAVLSTRASRGATPPAAAASGVDVSGTWTVTVAYAASEATHTLHLRQRGNTIDGSHQGDFISRELTGTIDGRQVAVQSFYGEEHGDALNYRFTGTIDGDTIAGTLDMGEIPARDVARIETHEEQPEMTQTTRRRFLAVPAAAAAAVAVPGLASVEAQAPAPVKKVHWRDGKRPEKQPLFSGVVSYGNLVFISGIGAHFEGDIKAHTDHVLKEIQKRLEEVGSSMEKVLKVNVYLNDLNDYAAMNEVFLGRFGAEPGVRTTIAAAGGIPGNSLVEIDCIACI